MRITCMQCGKRRFEVKPADVENVGSISFVCSSCGKTTAVEMNDCGGVTVGLVDRSKWPQNKGDDAKAQQGMHPTAQKPGDG